MCDCLCEFKICNHLMCIQILLSQYSVNTRILIWGHQHYLNYTRFGERELCFLVKTKHTTINKGGMECFCRRYQRRNLGWRVQESHCEKVKQIIQPLFHQRWILQKICVEKAREYTHALFALELSNICAIDEYISGFANISSRASWQ